MDERCRTNREAQCGFATSSLEFASPEYLSVRSYTGQSENCEPRGGRNRTVLRTTAFTSDSALPVDTLGPGARAEFLRVLLDTTHRDPELNCPAAHEATMLHELSAWSIARDIGRWVAWAFVQYGPEGCSWRTRPVAERIARRGAFPSCVRPVALPTRVRQAGE